jgi:hypothetical protein
MSYCVLTRFVSQRATLVLAFKTADWGPFSGCRSLFADEGGDNCWWHDRELEDSITYPVVLSAAS